ncbi:hypothetical protein L593_08505 [Salinarchaeum sp. Harcht-Bsk1]|uniref:DUF7089 family protein n=1 Tax=Salinarchaeum sp. Harcht-Bsk1 TaxID=1333523 RepID=UPI0003423BB9|nr:hypothetical protein [Salinarchaeum sp. Harcht-Bsk1]AGN01646.1 hypothetical protein L593_08505 [Salinarchaeum sp. Harcht-Bsk1]
MFSERALSAPVAAVRERHAPDAQILDTEQDFETLDPAVAEDLGLLVDRLEPHRYPAAWLPPDSPALLEQYASSDFTIGAPGDGSVVWTRQTEPPTILVKPRIEGSPESFVDFLLAHALVQLGLDVSVPGVEDGGASGDGAVETGGPGSPPSTSPPPEHFLGFFREHYPALADATPLDPAGTYQLAAALYDAWLGLHTRDVFAEWVGADDEDLSKLGDAWQDAGDRLEGRLDGLPGEVARGETDFPDAAELACAAVKHALELPAPYAALDTEAYRNRGAPFAVKWAEKTFDALE